MSEQNGETVTEPIKEIVDLAKPAPLASKYFNFIPKDLTELMKYSEMIAGSQMVPKQFFGKPGDVLVAIQYGAELGLPPLQALQNIAVINGRPGIFGDLGKAMLLSKGFTIEERDTKDTQALGEAWCRITRPGSKTSTERTFSLENAKTAKLWGKEGPWTNYPYRQMGWRAFWFAARDAAADVLKGISGIEELMDYRTDAIDATLEEVAPKEVAPEPTPTNPVVDTVAKADYLIPEERAKIVAELKAHNINQAEFCDYLKDKFGITESVKPTSMIQRKDYASILKWITTQQEEMPLK